MSTPENHQYRFPTQGEQAPEQGRSVDVGDLPIADRALAEVQQLYEKTNRTQGGEVRQGVEVSPDVAEILAGMDNIRTRRADAVDYAGL